jgi:hypothetical protein
MILSGRIWLQGFQKILRELNRQILREFGGEKDLDGRRGTWKLKAYRGNVWKGQCPVFGGGTLEGTFL